MYGRVRPKKRVSFLFPLFCFCQRLFVLWRPVLMYVRSLLFDNKPDFYFVSCTLYLCSFLLFSVAGWRRSGKGELTGKSRSPKNTSRSTTCKFKYLLYKSFSLLHLMLLITWMFQHSKNRIPKHLLWKINLYKLNR